MPISRMRRTIPPGPIYLFHDVIPYFILLGATTLTLLKSLEYAGIHMPTWSYYVALGVCYPITRFITLLYYRLQARREMKAKNAIAIPEVQASSRDIIASLMHSYSHGYPGEVFWDWALQYGNTYSLDIYSEKRVVTNNPEHLKAVLVTQFSEFEKAPLLLSQWKDLLGTGVFNADGDMWRFHRNMTRPFFSKDRIADFDNFERHTAASIALIKERFAEGHPVDIQDLICRFTLDSSTEYLFDKDVESLSAGLSYPDHANVPNTVKFENHPSNVFVRAFVAAQWLIAERARFGRFWALKELSANKVRPLRIVVDDYIGPMVKEALAKKASGKMEKQEEENLLASLVRETDDEEAINDELLNILVAGRDTTAALITFVFYALSRNPQIMERLREEIATVVGKRAPTYADIRDMRFLRAVLNETLRLYPPVPFDSRTCNVSTTLPNKDGKPYYLAKGTKVIYGLHSMHRRTDLWGPTALEFDPDRFIDDRLKTYLVHNPFIFLPFNAGPRICLGQQFAYNEASYFIVRLLQTFSTVSIAEEAQSPESRPPQEWFEEKVEGSTRDRDTIAFGIHLTMFAKGGLWVHMAEEAA